MKVCDEQIFQVNSLMPWQDLSQIRVQPYLEVDHGPYVVALCWGLMHHLFVVEYDIGTNRILLGAPNHR